MLSSDPYDWLKGRVDRPWGDPSPPHLDSIAEREVGENDNLGKRRDCLGSMEDTGIAPGFKKEKKLKDMTHPLPQQVMWEIQQHIIFWKESVFKKKWGSQWNHVYNISNNVCFVVVGTESSSPRGGLNHLVWMQKPSLCSAESRDLQKTLECEKNSNSWKFQPAGSSFPRPVCFGLSLPFLSFFL